VTRHALQKANIESSTSKLFSGISDCSRSIFSKLRKSKPPAAARGGRCLQLRLSMFRMPAPVLSAVAGRHLASLLLLCLAAFTAAAQDGHINGTVLRAGTAPNAAGAPVAGATVTAINQVTTERSTRRTDAGGAFS